MGKYDDILTRLKEATGPDRELDGLIYGVVNGLKPCGTFHLDIDGERFQFEHPTNILPSGAKAALYEHGDKVGEFTASIDAALALVEKTLPGWLWWACHLDQNDRRFVATIAEKALPDLPAHRGIASAAPLAILIALFEALKAKEPQP